MSNSKVGHSVSNATKEKMRVAHIGQSVSASTRIKISEARRGWVPSEATRKRMSEARRGWVPSEATREKMRINRAKQIFPVRDTRIEVRVQTALTFLGIVFECHGHIATNDLGVNRHQFDLVLKACGTIIEVDGCYWHGCTSCYPESNEHQVIARERDAHRTHVAQLTGWRMIRIAEHVLNSMSRDDLVGFLREILLTEERYKYVTSVGG
jgi:G:T-mismatch repair DNA endonuclease (very short patch repair protein)